MQASGDPIPLTTHRIQQFGQDIIAAVQQQITDGAVIQPSVYFLPGMDMPEPVHELIGGRTGPNL